MVDMVEGLSYVEPIFFANMTTVVYVNTFSNIKCKPVVSNDDASVVDVHVLSRGNWELPMSNPNILNF